jgi:hypothetical protein
MKSFNQFVKFREADGNQQPIAPGAELPYNQVAGNAQMPPMAQSQYGSSNDDAMLEDLNNSIRKMLATKLYPLLDKSPMSRMKAMNLLSSLVAEVSNRYGLSASNVKKATTDGLRTNSEPSSPPLQPMANG